MRLLIYHKRIAIVMPMYGFTNSRVRSSLRQFCITNQIYKVWTKYLHIYIVLQMATSLHLIIHVSLSLCDNQKYTRESLIYRFKNYARQFFLALALLHSFKISHGDVKLTNTLFNRVSVLHSWSFTLLDFGMSVNVGVKTHLSFYSGTSSFLSPEAALQIGVMSCGI